MIPPIHTLHDLIISGEISPYHLFKKSAENISHLNPDINSFATLRPFNEPTIHKHSSSPLYGIPYSVKDIIDTKNLRTEYGSEFFKGHVPQEDADVIRALDEYGPVLQGKTNTHEFAMGIVTPVCNNPWNVSKITGGSSGGSAAAVSSGLSLFSLGTDTAGSIRIPSSMCGVSGLKPTTGSLSVKGIFPEAWSLDTVGPITRYASDIPAIVTAMGFKSPRAKSQRRKPLLGIIGNLTESSDTNVKFAFYSFMDHMVSEDLVDIKEIHIDNMESMATAADMIDGCENATIHRSRYENNPELFSVTSRNQIKYYSSLKPMDYIEAQRLRMRQGMEFNSLFNQYDFLVSPTLPTIAPDKKEIENVPFDYFMKYIKFTNPFNLFGVPALSITCGFSRDMPVGLQIVGGKLRDIEVCNLASRFQEITDFHTRIPPIAKNINYFDI